MAVRVSPTEQKPTHHFSLRDRAGTLLGLMACKDSGEARDLWDPNFYTKMPVETTAMKQTSSNSSYDIFDYPYSPIVQDNLAGGRGGRDYERDSTKYYDSYRCLSGRSNIAYAGPLEKYAVGLRSQNETMPGSVNWQSLTGVTRHIYKRFQASASYTAARVWLLARRKGLPADMTISIYSDNSGELGTILTSITVSYTRLPDILSEWLNESISQALVSGNYYWLVAYAAETDDETKHWEVGVNEEGGTTYATAVFKTAPTAALFDLYYRMTDAKTDNTCIPFEYKEAQYFVISGSTGAPKLYIAGDRGTANVNANLNLLNDAKKAWTANEWVGMVVMVTDGTGKLEKQNWRVITANTGTALTVDTPWIITHDTTTEYVILGTKLTEITGHGLTAPVTSVLVTTKGIILFAQGDSVNIRRAKFETSGGNWTATYANDGSNKAVFLAYKPQAGKIVKGNNSDANGDVSVAFASPVDWGTASHTFTATPIKVDSKYRRITGMITYPDMQGVEQIMVFKTDLPYWVTEAGVVVPMNIEEMKTVRSEYNGRNPLVSGVYLYFPLLQGLERYYGGNVDDMGPNLGDGLPESRRGPIVSMLGYPGKFFIAVDAGSTGYSSIMDSGGWHERYRAPKGQQILAMAFQVIPGTTIDRLWVYQGNDMIWLPFPSNTNELQDSSYEYAPEFAVEHSRMHAGMFDVQKIIKAIKLQTENLELDDDGKPLCWFELDYKLDADEDWTTIESRFTKSPNQTVDFTDIYGIAGKRVKFRIRGYTRDKNRSPAFIALIVSAVIRVDVKNMYGPYSILVEDEEQAKGLREEGDGYTAAEKLKILEDWSDASNDSMLMLNSVSSLCDGRLVFMNMGSRRQINFKRLDGNQHTGDKYIVSLSFQEA